MSPQRKDADQRPTRLERKRANRLARVRDAVNSGDEAAHLVAAFEFARATIKRMPLDQRDAARRGLAELIVNHTLNDLDAINFTRLEAVA